MTLEEKVRDTIHNYDLFSYGDGVLVGVSGGPDSVALLHLMSKLRGEYGWRLAVAHLVHGIRGEEAREDALFVAELAGKLAVPIHLKEVDLPRMRTEGTKGNLEELGRKERYEFFGAVAEQCGLTKIATAHTRDDQAETLLMRLLRGSGSRGLSGMPAVRQLKAVAPGKVSPWLVRPLIKVSRQEILVYIAEQGLDHRTDQTNLDPRPLRNWIRHHLLPQLRMRIDGRVDERLAHMAEILRDEDRVLDRVTRERLERVGRDGCLMRDSFLGEDKSVQRRLVRSWLEANSGNLRAITFGHIEAVLRLVAQNSPQGRLSLPGGWDVVRQYETIRLERRELKKIEPVRYSYILPCEGEVIVPEAGVKIQSSWCSSTSAPQRLDNLEALLDSAFLPDTLRVRNFLPGDRFQPLGMQGHKKIKDLFIEKKVPIYERRTLPLVLGGEEILWIPKYGRSNVAKIGPQTSKILKVKLTSLDV